MGFLKFGAEDPGKNLESASILYSVLLCYGTHRLRSQTVGGHVLFIKGIKLLLNFSWLKRNKQVL
jgi:hypothetical protein